VQQASQAAEKVIESVIPSGARNLSGVWTHEKEREIPRSARNDRRVGEFFCKLFSLCDLGLAGSTPPRLKPVPQNAQADTFRVPAEAVAAVLLAPLDAAGVAKPPIC